MKYMIGIDGGGTKTEGVLCNEKGDILCYCRGSASNYQLVGTENMVKTITCLIDDLLQPALREISQVSYIFIGLAGADSPSDITFLNGVLGPVFGETPHKIVNDCWIALAAESEENWGVISICGTGCNAAIRNRMGKEFTLRGLRYEYGNFGGGHDLVRDALHYAFRASEHTGPDTGLALEIPRILGLPNMDAVAQTMQQDSLHIISNCDIVKLIFILANTGDSVSQNILIHMGTVIGEMLGYFILSTHLEGDKVPIVLSGSLYYKAENRLLFDALKASLGKWISRFRLTVNQYPPVLGACYYAFKELHLSMEPSIRALLRKNLLSEVKKAPSCN